MRIIDYFIRFNVSLILGFSILMPSLSLLTDIAFADSDECSREWVGQKTSQKNFLILGLGLSSNDDPATAHQEARAAAIKDISLQLQSSIQSSSEIKESQSSSHFKSDSILTSNLDNLVGLKAIKSGKNINERITRCEVYEFNVRAAYDDLSSKLSVIQDKLTQVLEDSGKGRWLDLIREIPPTRTEFLLYQEQIQRADVFKTYMNIPGPTWNEKLNKMVNHLEDADKKARANIVFILPEKSFENTIAEVSQILTNSGLTVATSTKELKSESLGVEVQLKSLGKPRKSKTQLGLTITQRVSIALVDAKTKAKLAAGNGLSIVGTSANNDEEEATANSEMQLTTALVDAIKSMAPGLIQTK